MDIIEHVTANDQSDSLATQLTSTTESSSPVIQFDISLHSDGDAAAAATAAADDDDIERLYRPGDLLCGELVLVLASPLSVSTISVELRGEASVSWKTDDSPAASLTTRGRRSYGVSDRDMSACCTAGPVAGVTTSVRHSYPVSARRHPRPPACSRWYETNELYIDEQQNIAVCADDDLLETGEHRFPISFQLPRGLPTSFRGKYGAVSYALRASFVDRTRRSSRHVVSAPFIVRRPSAPLTSQTKAKPVKVKLIHRLFAAAPYICGSGLLRVDFRVSDGTAFHLGDHVDVAVQITNNSPRVVLGVSVSLVQVSEFSAQTARRRHVALVSRHVTQDGYADTGRSLNFRLNIPRDLPESHLDGCDVIDVGYELRFAVEVVHES